jgi:nicotinate-nucleotide pyrophosphorylase (carboxylating)
MKPSRESVDAIVRVALLEDSPWGDLTSQTLIPADATVNAELVAREQGFFCGQDIVSAAFYLTDPAIATGFRIADGQAFPARGILQVERVALNFA